MQVELAIAALGWFVLAFGHTRIGLRRVLPNLTQERLPSTLSGPPSMPPSTVRLRGTLSASSSRPLASC